MTEIATVISTAKGELGSCADYLLQTVEALAKCNITDQNLILVRDRLSKKCL